MNCQGMSMKITFYEYMYPSYLFSECKYICHFLSFYPQSLAKLRERFLFDQTIGRSEPDLSCSPAHSQLSLSRQTLDAGSQTDISGDVSFSRHLKVAKGQNYYGMFLKGFYIKWLAKLVASRVDRTSHTEIFSSSQN